MEEKNELNDIILNKGASSGGSKKVLLAIATLAIILIIVVVIMNRINSEGTKNLPQAVLPPEPSNTAGLVEEDPLFEPVTVIEETPSTSDNLDKIAQKLKEETLMEEKAADVKEEEVIIVEPIQPETAVKPVEKPVVKPVAKPVAKTPVKTTPTSAIAKGKYYVQVGSFSKYAPNEKFIKSITNNGFSYTYHKVVRSGKTINKVLVGPFESEKAARNALSVIRKKIEPGAFLTKV